MLPSSASFFWKNGGSQSERRNVIWTDKRQGDFSQHTCVNLLRRLWDEEFGSIRVRRYLDIPNCRLSCLQGVLQLAVVLVCLSYFFGAAIWLGYWKPIHFGHSLWVEPPHDRLAALNVDDPHCMDPQNYSLEHDGETFEPEGCKTLADWEAWEVHGPSLFIPTHVHDERSMHFHLPDRCTDNASMLCRSNGGLWEEDQGGEYCECNQSDTFLVQSVDELRLCFTPDRIQSWWAGDDLLWVRTVTVGADDNPFEINGQSKYLSWETSSVCGTLREWVAAGGEDIDSESSGIGMLRSNGFGLDLDWGCASEVFFVVNCDLRVHVHSARTLTSSATHVDLTAVPGEVVSTHKRRSFGVLVHAMTDVKLPFFNVYFLIDGLVDLFFLLKLPGWVMMFLIMYGMGTTSQIYREASVTEFGITSQLKQLVARLWVPLMTHCGLTDAGWDVDTPPEEEQSSPRDYLESSAQGSDPDLFALSAHQRTKEGVGCSKWRMYSHLREIFAEELEIEEVTDRDMIRMIGMVYGQDPSRNTMSLSDFTRMCAANEVINMNDAAILCHHTVTEASKITAAIKRFEPKPLQRGFSTVSKWMGEESEDLRALGSLAAEDESSIQVSQDSNDNTSNRGAADAPTPASQPQQSPRGGSSSTPAVDAPHKLRKHQWGAIPESRWNLLDVKLKDLEIDAHKVEEGSIEAERLAAKVAEKVENCTRRLEAITEGMPLALEGSAGAEAAAEKATAAAQKALWHGAVLDDLAQELLDRPAQSHRSRRHR